jgi:hypothetical protein
LLTSLKNEENIRNSHSQKKPRERQQANEIDPRWDTRTGKKTLDKN